MSKILVKQVPNVQQFQNIGVGQRPTIGALWNRMRDPTAGGWQKVNAGLGLAGKAGALAGTVLQTANQLQGGNITAPLGMGYTYAGLDPTGGMIGQGGNVTPAEQQAAIKEGDLEASRHQDLQNLTTVGLDAAQLASQNQTPTQQQLDDLAALQANKVDPRQAQLEQARAAQAAAQPTQITNVPTTPLGAQQTQAQPAQPAQPAQAQPAQPAQAQPAQPAQIAPTAMAQVLPPMSGQAPQPAAPAPAPAPAPAAPIPVMQPQGDEIDQFIANRGRMPASNIDHNEIDAMNADEVRRKIDMMKSFVDMMFNEFGDLFQKQDPNVVASIITGVYLDKMVR